MKKILLNVVSVLLAALVFYFLGKELFKNWAEIKNFPFHFNILLLTASSVLYAGAFFVFAIGWYLLLKYLHHPISFREAILYFFITQPAKYIPGKIWIGVARMKFCKPRGIPNSVTLLTTGIEATLEIMSGAYISLIALLQIDALGKFSVLGTLVLTILGLLLLVPRFFYFFINLYLRVVRRPPIEKASQHSFRKLLLLQIVYLAGTFGMGLSQAVFLLSFSHVSISYLPFLVSIGAFSYIASILAIFTPSGLGVREGIWYFALKNLTSPHIALIYAFVSRLWIIIVEAILLFIALPLFWVIKRKTKLFP